MASTTKKVELPEPKATFALRQIAHALRLGLAELRSSSLWPLVFDVKSGGAPRPGARMDNLRVYIEDYDAWVAGRARRPAPAPAAEQQPEVAA